MAIKASVGLARKVGQENYGSLGAHCQLEIELDGALLSDAEAFHEHIQQAYALANQAVVDQLAEQAAARGNGRGCVHVDGRDSGLNHDGPGSVDEQGCVNVDRRGNGNGSRNARSTRNGDDNTLTPASNKQIKFLLDLARQRHNMSLTETADYCRQIVGEEDVYQLTKQQASRVIDQLNQKSGNGRRAR